MCPAGWRRHLLAKRIMRPLGVAHAQLQLRRGPAVGTSRMASPVVETNWSVGLGISPWKVDSNMRIEGFQIQNWKSEHDLLMKFGGVGLRPSNIV